MRVSVHRETYPGAPKFYRWVASDADRRCPKCGAMPVTYASTAEKAKIALSRVPPCDHNRGPRCWLRTLRGWWRRVRS